MHILKMMFYNISLFKDDLTIDFTNSDTVRRSSEDSDHVQKAFKIKAGVYTQVLIGLTGLNATGKTTILELLSSVSQILIDGEKLNESSIKGVLQKLYPRSAYRPDDLMAWDVFFTHNKHVYKLHSVINRERDTDKNDFYYAEEVLWEKSLASTKHENLFDFTDDQIRTTRKKEVGNPYFKKDMSIVASLGAFSEVLRPIGIDTMANFPVWVGEPTQEALHLFDPNISNLSIEEKADGALECRLNFSNQKVGYGGSPMLLNKFLSAGTIRGLNIMPAIVRALSKGGYIIIDELENHFNRKIIEWFLDLFTDKRTNPHGACLIFSTHYPELLNVFSRKDNIFITRRDKNNYCECVKYSAYITRNELSKGKIILENAIQGTAPRYKDLQAARQWVESTVKKVNKI